MFNLDYITTQTRLEVLDSLKYDINKYDENDLDNLHKLYENDEEVISLIAENFYCSFATLFSIASENNENYFTSLLNNINIVNYKSIIKYIIDTSESVVNIHIATRLIEKLEEYI